VPRLLKRAAVAAWTGRVPGLAKALSLFVEQLHHSLLYRWFLDMDLSEPVFDNSTFSKNQERGDSRLPALINRL
jgi:hypothetical protein